MNNVQLIQNINPKIVKYKDTKYYLAINCFFGYENNPAYTIFLDINDKIFDSSNDIVIFLYSLQGQSIDIISETLANGVDGKYIYGEDYAISWSLYRYLSTYDNNSQIALLSNFIDNKYIFPDLIDSQFNLINTDTYTTIADTNLLYYYKLNKFVDSVLSEDELNSFVKTFCRIILDNTTLDDFSDINNSIYRNVLNYYANGGTDDAVVMLNLILGNSGLVGSSSTSCCDAYSVSTGTNASNTVSSTIPNLSELVTTTSVSCKDVYQNAMFLYLQKMLGDVHFYCDWFMITTEDEDAYPNQVLVKKLKQLFDEFFDLNYNLTFSKKSNGHDCKCDNKNYFNSSENDNNYNILHNYYKVLTYVEDDVVEPNCNKIQVYGSEFGSILPHLMFV